MEIKYVKNDTELNHVLDFVKKTFSKINFTFPEELYNHDFYIDKINFLKGGKKNEKAQSKKPGNFGGPVRRAVRGRAGRAGGVRQKQDALRGAGKRKLRLDY